MNDITARLKKVILRNSAIQITEEQIHPESHLIDDLGYDSVKQIELIINLEDEFDIFFEDEDFDLDKISIFGRLEEFINEKLTLAD